MRISTKDALSKKSVTVAGWVEQFRVMKEIKFIILRDYAGTLQITIPRKKVSANVFNIDLTKESVIQVTGDMVPNKEARGGKELIPKKIEVISKAEQLPIDISGKIKTGLSKRLDWRHLDLRRPEIEAIFRIQAEICKLYREYFRKQGFVEIWPPAIISAASEGGTELFSIDYFDRKAFLAQSPQLYKQLCVMTNLEKVFSITPVWRAEPHDTQKHLNEIRQMDIEVAFADDHDVMKYLGDCMVYIVKNIKKNMSEELKLLKRDLKVPKVIKLSYKEAIDVLKKKRFEIKFGDDISSEAEKRLSQIYGSDNVVFTYDWPLSQKPFYIMPKDKKLAKAFDAIYGGRELCSGGQRVHIPDLLKERIKASDLDPKNFKFYIDSFKYGAAPHAGWSIGLERLTMGVCGLSNIREACLYPRDGERTTP